MKTVVRLIYSIPCIVILGCGSNYDREEYLIPNNYIGTTMIIFNQEDGQQKDNKNGIRIYNLDTGGVFATQFETNPGAFTTNDRNFYYVDQANVKQIEIKWISTFSLFHRLYDPKNKYPKSKIGLDDIVAVTAPIVSVYRSNDSLLGKDFSGHISYLTVDTFKNLLKYQRPPDSIYYKKWQGMSNNPTDN